METTDDNKEIIRWHHMVDTSTTLSQKIDERCQQTGQRFDRFLTLARGGWHTANIVSRELGFRTPECYNMSITSYVGRNRQEGYIVGQRPTDEEIDGHRWLVVDEVWDTGGTGLYTRNLLRRGGAVDVFFAVDYLKEPVALATTGFLPDVATHVVDGRWLEFPWEDMERSFKFQNVRWEAVEHDVQLQDVDLTDDQHPVIHTNGQLAIQLAQ